ncbi:MAG: YbaB/EbfC family nucleoid-associated protein [Phycicoccus sp.]
MRPDPDVDEVLASLAAERRTFVEAQREIAAVSARAESPDRTVAVTVSGGGALAGVTIRPEAFDRRDPSRLERSILAAYAAASTAAAADLDKRLPGLFPAPPGADAANEADESTGPRSVPPGDRDERTAISAW